MLIWLLTDGKAKQIFHMFGGENVASLQSVSVKSLIRVGSFLLTVSFVNYCFLMIDMSKSYNLRSSGKKKELRCYLQELSEYDLPQDFQPEVRLERLKVLETPEYENFTFYLKQNKIVRKDSRRLRNKKILFLISFAVILFSLFLVYWQNELQICGFIFYRRITILQNNLREYYFENIDPYKYKIEKYLSVFLKTPKHKNLNEHSQNDDFIEAFNKMEIQDLVKTYMEASYSENISSELPVSQSGDQCKAESESTLTRGYYYARKYKFYNATYFESGNLTDYALASQGAKIVNTFDTEPYGIFTVQYFNYDFGPFLSYLLLENVNSFSRKGPASILIPWQKPGDCWAFKGSHGKVQIQLSEEVMITAVTIDHIPRNLSPYKNVLSAPKRFSVFGIVISNDDSTRQYLGSFEYRVDGPPMQTFSVDFKTKAPTSSVELIIESNQGNEMYTCLYKIRVHGYV